MFSLVAFSTNLFIAKNQFACSDQEKIFNKGGQDVGAALSHSLEEPADPFGKVSQKAKWALVESTGFYSLSFPLVHDALFHS